MEKLFSIAEVDAKLGPLMSEKKVGFVPTMGALHAGHISLVRKAQAECDVVVVSIFVNPTQFNNQDDLLTYPRQEGEDIRLLEEVGCDFVFLPTVEVIYPEAYLSKTVDLGFVGTTMEGAHRPGHFDGVVNVVSRLFEIITPDKAYFGKKDFQQVAVIRLMTRALDLPVEIVAVDTKREASGLAMSSRNLRLNEQERADAVIIIQTLKKGREWSAYYSPIETLERMTEFFNMGGLQLEYLTIVHPLTLAPLTDSWVPGATACIVAYCGSVRLIDNLEMIDG